MWFEPTSISAMKNFRRSLDGLRVCRFVQFVIVVFPDHTHLLFLIVV